MARSKQSLGGRKRISHELVVGFGFLTGIWTAIGISPDKVVFTFLDPFLASLPPWVRVASIIIPAFLTLFSLFKVWKSGKFWGMVAVALAFVGGTFALTEPSLSGGLLVAGFLLGLISFRK